MPILNHLLRKIIRNILAVVRVEEKDSGTSMLPAFFGAFSSGKIAKLVCFWNRTKN